MTGPQLLSITSVECWGDHVKSHGKVSKHCRYLLLKAFWMENFSPFKSTLSTRDLRKLSLVAFCPILDFLVFKFMKMIQKQRNLGLCAVDSEFEGLPGR